MIPVDKVWQFLTFRECYQLLQVCKTINKSETWYETIPEWMELVLEFPLIKTVIELNLVTADQIIKLYFFTDYTRAFFALCFPMIFAQIDHLPIWY